MLEFLVALLVSAVADCRVPVLEIPVAKADAALSSGMETPAVKAGGKRERPFQKRIKALRERGKERRASRGK